MLARCPSCRSTFSTDRTGRQECPACGKALVVPEAPLPGAAGPSATDGAPSPAAAGADQPPPGTPWERRADGARAALTAWRETLVLALFEPGRLFARARLDQGRRQLSFALWTASIFWALGQLIDRLLLGPQREQMTRLFTALRGDRPIPPALLKLIESGNANSPQATLLAALLTPLFALALLYANAGVTHLAALLLGQNRRGFAATFAAAAYGVAPVVLFAIPGCGALVGAIWCAVLTGVGLKYTHGMSTGGAVGAALAPYALLCAGLCAASVLFASLLLPAFGQAP